tara:strand:- start:836 stop:1075 length:240 start_codon:yes stop_codon:yes gene_type:complete
MIIYGHSGQDIRRMMWRKRYRLLTVAVLIFGAVALMGCNTVPKKLEGENLLVKETKLKALDSFWDTLGGKKTDLIEKIK